ncbi:MAG: 16S rRNA (guanine(527)-N(7))-methyltransferase RsmG [Eubacteriales bacterium]
MSMREYLKEALTTQNITLSEEQYAQFEQLYEALKETSQHTNLTTILDEAGVAEKHFADSLLPISLKLIKGDEKIIDVGSGAGFPGLPLKIVYPDLDLTLLEATGKKCAFIENTAERLGLNILLKNGRAEEIAHAEIARMCYDICVSRAVARLNMLLELCAGFVKPGGRILAYKGEKAEEEIKEAESAARKLGLCFVGLYEDKQGKTKIAVYERKEKLKDIYPRKFSNIKNKAL